MKVLIADKFEKVGIDGLKELGCEVVSQPDVKAEGLAALIRETDPHILIVRSKKVGAEALSAGTALTLVIRAGAGIDTIDVATASSRGIFVSNCPGKNSIAVAELVMGLLLACDRRIPDQVADLRQGRWSKGEFSKARGLYGRRLGVVGLGQIGREVARRAQAFGMKVVAWSRNLTDEAAERLGIGRRLEHARAELDRVGSPAYLQGLVGTIGADPVHRPARGRPGWTPVRSSACTAGCTPPARAGASTPRIATRAATTCSSTRCRSPRR